jgi:hypothetical protein
MKKNEGYPKIINGFQNYFLPIAKNISTNGNNNDSMTYQQK